MKKIATHHKFIIWLGCSVLSGSLAVWAAYQHLEQERHLLVEQTKLPTVPRVVAAYGLEAGTVLTESHLAVREFHVQSIPRDSVEPSQYSVLVGTALRAHVAAGDLILGVHTEYEREQNFSARLADGRRAVTMPVNQINSLAGLLRVGDLVDLYVSFDHQRRKITAPLLQGVLVIATDEQTDSNTVDNAQFTTVTFDLSPEEGAKLVAARQAGMITAMLRNPHDAHISSKGIRGDLASLLGLNATPTEYKSVLIIYGNKTHRQVRGAEATPKAGKSAVLDVDTPAQLSFIQESFDVVEN